MPFRRAFTSASATASGTISAPITSFARPATYRVMLPAPQYRSYTRSCPVRPAHSRVSAYMALVCSGLVWKKVFGPMRNLSGRPPGPSGSSSITWSRPLNTWVSRSQMVSFFFSLITHCSEVMPGTAAFSAASRASRFFTSSWPKASTTMLSPVVVVRMVTVRRKPWCARMS